MELAKIRSKAMHEEQQRAVAGASAGNQPLPQEPAIPPALTVPDELAVGDTVEMVIPGPAGAPPVKAPTIRFDPLAVILAGRQADQSAVLEPAASDEPPDAVTDGDERYLEFLCFMVGAEEYGINIMEIKELIKPRELTEVPRAPHFVDGIISLRGTIVPVIELSGRLGLHAGPSGHQERVVIVRHGDGFVGLRVDAVTGVVRIAEQRRESAPAVLDGLDREFVAGIGRSDDRMIILLDTQRVANIDLPGEA